ncbi:hypothetical protein [Methylobacterium pseudosasicola]|nr:hypothetical protein [Methylobacterium pseudosasicola]
MPTLRRCILVGLMLISLVALADGIARVQLANAVAGFQGSTADVAG